LNRKQFFKLYVLVFIALYSEFNFANREMFVPLPLSGNDISAAKKECPRVGSISGRIQIFDTKYFNPEYYKNIVIRVSGINYSNPNSILYEYYPDEEGCFSIKNNFHIGSSLLLYIWDTNSKYYYKTINAYVGLKTNYYDISIIPFEDVIYTSDAFDKKINENMEPYNSDNDEVQTESSTQSLNNAGMCGYAVGMSPGDILGTKIMIENSKGKKFKAKYYNHNNLPSSNFKKLSMSGHFCVFNLNSCDENESNCSDNANYKINFNLKNGESKSFDIIIPDRTFSDNSIFDLKAAVYRPLDFYAIKDFNSNVWDKTSDVEVNMTNNLTNNDSLKGLQYFPVGDDIVKLNYKTSATESDRYFKLIPTSELFTSDMFKYEYHPGMEFVDKKNIINIRVFDPNALNLNKEYLAPLYNTNTGSTFFSLDLSRYNTQINSVKLEIRNVYGALVRSSVSRNHYRNEVYDSSINENDFSANGLNDLKIINSNQNYLNGFIYNLKPGYYQIFLVDKKSNGKEEILFTNLVQSFPNKTQVITDSVEPSPNKNSNNDKAYVIASNVIPNQDSNSLQWNPEIEDKFLKSDVPFDVPLKNNSSEINELRNEKLLINSNLFFKYSTDELCGFTRLKTVFLEKNKEDEDLIEKPPKYDFYRNIKLPSDTK
jgi:hypothetical protein